MCPLLARCGLLPLFTPSFQRDDHRWLSSLAIDSQGWLWVILTFCSTIAQIHPVTGHWRTFWADVQVIEMALSKDESLLATTAFIGPNDVRVVLYSVMDNLTTATPLVTYQISSAYMATAVAFGPAPAITVRIVPVQGRVD